MKCPKCGSLQSKVADSRELFDGKLRHRKRFCMDCENVYFTKEVVYVPSDENILNVALKDGAFKPQRAYPTDAGLDLRSPQSTKVPAMGTAVIDTLVSVAIPEGYVGLITSKSGLMLKGITSRGTIDSSYRGTIKAVLYNSTKYDYQIQCGDKITQLVILPIITPEIRVVSELSETDRNDGGFGSTGR